MFLFTWALETKIVHVAHITFLLDSTALELEHLGSFWLCHLLAT